jgi:hypothetical protein
MSFSNAFELDILKLLFQNTNIANLGDAVGVRGSTVAGSLYIALHTANPGAAGNQSTSEAAYAGYARVAVARSGAGWATSGSSPTAGANVAAVTFPVSASGPETETHFSIGRDAAGAGEILWFGSLTASLVVNNLVTPSFPIGQLIGTML